MDKSGYPPAFSALAGFEDVVRDTLQTWKVPGLAITIVKDDQVVCARGFGFRDVAQQLEVTPRTLFPIASCTKAFTATTLAILVDEGKLDWDTPVRAYLPELRLADPVATERITPRDLLCHRSGLPRHDLTWYNAAVSRADLVARLRHLEPSADLRAVYQYNNLMFMLAGYLVERLAGQTWEAFTRARIFAPLGMAGTLFSTVEARRTAEFSQPYQEKDGEVRPIAFYDAQDAIAPAGAIVSSVEDLSKWLRLQLGHGVFEGRRIVSEAQLAETRRPQMATPGASRYPEILPLASYALGWSIEAYRGQPVVTHTGGIDGFASRVALLPDERLGVAILTNLSGAASAHTALAYHLFDRFLGREPIPWNDRFQETRDQSKAAEERKKTAAEEERVPGTRPSRPLAAFVGEYANPGYGTLRVELVDDALRAVYNGMTLPLSHHHYDVFRTEVPTWEVPLTLSFGGNVRGDVDRVAIPMEPEVDDVVFTRLPPAEMRQRSFLEQLVGEYDWLGWTIVVTLKGDDALILSLPGEPRRELVPDRGTEFHAKGRSTYRVAFTLDPSGRATEATITRRYDVLKATRLER